MTKRRGPSGPDIRDVKPTRILLNAAVTIDGGTIGRSQELDAVVSAFLRAFERTAHEQGLGYSWGLQLSCISPQRMTARIEKGDLAIEPAPSRNAEATADGKATSVGAHDSSSSSKVGSQAAALHEE